jgi:hypothetical protein
MMRSHKLMRASACGVGLLFALIAPVSSAKDAPLHDLVKPPDETTFCASCFPKRYRVRVGVHWRDRADLDLWLVLPPQQRREDPRKAAVWYENDVHVLPGQTDTQNGTDSAGWLDSDEVAKDMRPRYSEEIIVGWNARGPEPVIYPRSWCVLVDYFGAPKEHGLQEIAATVEIEAGPSKVRRCEVGVPTTSPESPNIPNLLQVCDGKAADTRELALAVITESTDGVFEIKTGEGWVCRGD